MNEHTHEQTRTDMPGHEQARTDASGDAQQFIKAIEQSPSIDRAHVAAPGHVQTRTHENNQTNTESAQTRPDAPMHARARTDAYGAPPQNWMPVDEALKYFEAKGSPKKLRTIQKYCSNAKLRAHLALTDIGVKYYIDPLSIDEMIARESQTLPVGGFQSPDEPGQGTHVQPRMDAPVHDDRASADYDIYDHPYVKRLEKQVERLEDKLQDTHTAHRNELMKLQEANLVALSSNFGDYLMQMIGIRGPVEKKSTTLPIDGENPEEGSRQ